MNDKSFERLMEAALLLLALLAALLVGAAIIGIVALIREYFGLTAAIVALIVLAATSAAEAVYLARKND